jgi:hypothetical protein
MNTAVNEDTANEDTATSTITNTTSTTSSYTWNSTNIELSSEPRVSIFSERTSTGGSDTTSPTAADWTSFVSFVRLCSTTNEHNTRGHRGSVAYTVRPRCQGVSRCSFTPKLRLRGVGCVAVAIRATTNNTKITSTACSLSDSGFSWADTADLLLEHDKPTTITVTYFESNNHTTSSHNSSSERDSDHLSCLDFDQLLLEHRAAE